jgi:hypothetical protein
MATEPKLTPLQNFLCGSMARMADAVIMCPADTIKTRLQFQGPTLKHVTQYNNFFHAFRVILRDEGPRGFTRGLPARLTYVTPAAGISFLCYEKLISALKKPKDEQHLWLDKVLPFAGIASARVMGTALRTPFDIVKQRMQVQDSIQNIAKYRNSVVAASAIVKQFGYRTLGQSIFVALCRDAPFAAVYFFTYEVAKRTQSELIGRDKMGLANHLLAGAAAGASGAIATAPMDVIKTRLQTEVSLPRDQRRYKGPITALRTIVRDEGVRGLYRGLGARLLYLTPSAALVWGFYESFKRGFLYINNTHTAVNNKS